MPVPQALEAFRPGPSTSGGERGAAQPRTPWPVAPCSLLQRGGPGSGSGPSWQYQLGSSHSDSSENMQEAAPQRSELSQPDSSPALPGNQCHASTVPPHPHPYPPPRSTGFSLLNITPGKSPLRPVCTLGHLKSVDVSCQEDSWGGPIFPSDPARTPSSLEHLSPCGARGWFRGSQAQRPLREEPASLLHGKGSTRTSCPEQEPEGLEGRGGSWQSVRPVSVGGTPALLFQAGLGEAWPPLGSRWPWSLWAAARRWLTRGGVPCLPSPCCPSCSQGLSRGSLPLHGG